jgi:glycosyltransferase involved in cell wall biosynthesis
VSSASRTSEERGEAQPSVQPVVLVVQRRLTLYRAPFFEALRPALADRGFALRLVVGDATAEEATKDDGGMLLWAEHVPCRYLFGGRLCWQDIRPWLAAVDYVVVTQENQLVMNWWLLARRRAGPSVALWGHGRNFRATGWFGALAHRLKAWLSRRADWWFAYTDLSARIVAGFGYPASRITTLNNAVDTSGLQQVVGALRSAGLEPLRQAWGLGPGPVGLFIGSLYADKRIDLLFDAVERVRRERLDFQLLVAGAGPDEAALRQRAAGIPGVRMVGSVRGACKAEAFALADVVLNPGAVGLGIVESFAVGLPIVVADTRNHGPELAYLEHDVNGLFTAGNAGAYAEAVLRLLNEPALAARLRAGALAAGGTCTQEAMVQHFCDGVEAWHAAPRLGTP